MPTRAIGFTGARKGLTPYQEAVVAGALAGLKSRAPGLPQAHHGDCVGADADFHRLALAAGLPVWVHPPDKDTYRAFCEDAEWTYEPAPYLTRNQHIVDAADVMIACPSGAEESQPRSGTWATIRKAQRAGVHLIIIAPEPA